jgi:hypothetical protein
MPLLSLLGIPFLPNVMGTKKTIANLKTVRRGEFGSIILEYNSIALT